MGVALGRGGDRLVGRAAELRTCRRVLDRARDGVAGMLLVSGEAGIGKTALCHAVAARAREDGFAVVHGACWPDAGAPPLWPWPLLLAERCGPDVAALLDRDDPATAVAPERFSRFTAIAEHLAAACDEVPTLLVVDDVHAAHPEALLLLRFLHRTLAHAPLVLLLARRDPVPAASGGVGLDQLTDDATVVTLAGLDREQVRALVRAAGHRDPDPDLIEPLLGLTGGNPLHVRRAMALGRTSAAVGALPAGVRGAIEGAAGRLAPESRRILRAASVLGIAPGVQDAAAVAGVKPAAVMAAAADGAQVGLTAPSDGDALRFTHELVREVLESALAPADLLDAHAVAATVIGAGGASTDRLARRAHHALRAATRSAQDARDAIPACRDAAAAMVRGLAYNQAAAVLADAVAALERADLQVPAVLRVERAEVVLLCGRLGEARGLAEQAAAAAELEGDPVLLARAALGLGGVWVGQQRGVRDHARGISLLQQALTQLEAADPPSVPAVQLASLRCRLRVRLAAEAAYPGGPTEELETEVGAARALGDPATLAEALSALHHVWLTPVHLPGRLAVAEELIGVAAAAGAEVWALMGLCWRAVDLFQLVDGRAGRALAEFRERADVLGCRSLLYVAGVMEVMTLIRAGDLDAAERRAHECHALGVEVGDADAMSYLGGHLITLRWLQGREEELLGVVEDMASSPDVLAADFSLRAGVAMVAARAGAHDRARALVADITADALSALPQTSTWLAGMFALVEVAACLQDQPLADQAHRLLQPYAEQPVLPSLAVTCLGSTERPLGIAALVCDRPEAAVAHLQRALAAALRLRNRPVSAITRADLAAALARRDGPGDRARATACYRQAADEADQLGLTPRSAAWRLALEELAELEGRQAVEARQAVAAPEAVEALQAGDSREAVAAREGRDPWDPPGEPGLPIRRATLTREGGHWRLEGPTGALVLTDRVGVQYLARLLASPGQPISSLALAGSTEDVEPVAQPVLDPAARAAYRTRLQELQSELEEADDHADLARAEHLRQEHDALLIELGRATGLGGRGRAFAAPAERARTAVRKALVRVLDDIAAGDPLLGAHLRQALRTGRECCYELDEGQPIRWTVHGS